MSSVQTSPQQPRVSVIVVSYNTCDLLRRCLKAIEPHHEIIVVDNASRDGSADMVSAEFAHVRLIRSNRNLGFGAANNVGMAAMSGRFALLLNSDAMPEPGAIDQLADLLDAKPDAVACGGRLLNADGSIQNSTANKLTLWAVFCEQTLLEKAFPSTTWLSPYWNTRHLDAAKPSPTTQVMGACLMLRPVGRFDERFFLYCEDTELCRRLERHGQLWYVPTGRFLHELGASSSSNRWASVARYNRGKELYFAIHHGRVSQVLCWILDRLGALLRVGLWLVPTLGTLGSIARFRSQVTLHLRVLTAPLAGPPNPPDSVE